MSFSATTMSGVVSFAKSARAALRARLWYELNKSALVVVNWHQVSDRFDPDLHHSYTWTDTTTFEGQLDYLAQRFTIIPLQEALDRASRPGFEGRFAALTFDDGDASMASHALPVLERKGLPATFFVNTAYIDQPRTYWFPVLSYLTQAKRSGLLPEALREEALHLRQTRDAAFYARVRDAVERLQSLVPDLAERCVSEAWLASLDGVQFALGCHGHEHQRYALMSAEWQEADLRQNLERLGAFKAFRPIFAIPFGRPWDWTDDTIRLARGLGLKIVLAAGGVNVGATDLLARMPGDSRDMGEEFAAATMSLPLRGDGALSRAQDGAAFR